MVPLEITYKDADGEVGQQILYRADEAKLGLATVSGPTFDAGAMPDRRTGQPGGAVAG